MRSYKKNRSVHVKSHVRKVGSHKVKSHHRRGSKVRSHRRSNSRHIIKSYRRKSSHVRSHKRSTGHVLVRAHSRKQNKRSGRSKRHHLRSKHLHRHYSCAHHPRDNIVIENKISPVIVLESDSDSDIDLPKPRFNSPTHYLPTFPEKTYNHPADSLDYMTLDRTGPPYYESQSQLEKAYKRYLLNGVDAPMSFEQFRDTIRREKDGGYNVSPVKKWPTVRPDVSHQNESEEAYQRYARKSTVRPDSPMKPYNRPNISPSRIPPAPSLPSDMIKSNISLFKSPAEIALYKAQALKDREGKECGEDYMVGTTKFSKNQPMKNVLCKDAKGLYDVLESQKPVDQRDRNSENLRKLKQAFAL